MADLSIIGLGKRFGHAPPSLWDINIQIGSGEFIVLVGPSGCGKSTLLRCIAGLEKPSEGRIELGGKRIDSLSPAQRGVGMVFQDYALYPHMNVRENLSFGLTLQRLPKDEISARVQETASMLGLETLLDRKPAQLSGGQRQRVAIGRALIKKPAIFLLDEPLSNLDAQLRAQTRLEIAELHQQIGSTTIYVTHDQEEAMTLADRIVVLKAGELQGVGTPFELYHRPGNRFVGSFIGSPTMNLIEGELLSGNQDVCLFRVGYELLELPASACPRVTGRYILGFRPEAFQWTERHLPLELKWIENHGFDVHLIAQWAGQRITLRCPEREVPRQLSSGSCFSVELNFGELHWFSTQGKNERVETVRGAVTEIERPGLRVHIKERTQRGHLKNNH
jgi:ABC-type sugar transport system ATPase subunit